MSFSNRQGKGSANIEHLWVEHVINGAEIPLLKKNTGQGSNFYWDGDTIYSYGRHFPIARCVTHKGKKAILFTRRTYSVTTSGHIARVRQALRGRDVLIFPVDRPDLDPAGYAGGEEKAYYERASQTAFEAAAKARGRAGQLLQDGLNLIEEGNRLSAFFGLKWKLKAPKDLDLKKLKTEISAREAKQAEADRKRLAEVRTWYMEEQAAWMEGRKLPDDQRLLKPILSYRDREKLALPTVLRLYAPAYHEAEGFGMTEAPPRHVVQTSLGAEVPLKDAKRLLALWESVKGTGYKHGEHTFHVGEFRLDEITADGTIKAGCHTILAAEVERFAPILKGV